MAECFKCGVSSEKRELRDAITNHGLVKICERCNEIERLPIVKRPTEEQINTSKNPRQVSVQERLNSMTKKGYIGGKEVTLRDLVDKDFKSKKFEQPSDLVTNFHWKIQMVRRNRKITREQFSKGIGESEATVRMIEQGFIPGNNPELISKIEKYLNINLRKNPDSSYGKRDFSLDKDLTEEAPETLSLEKEETKKLTIRDLFGIKKRREEKNGKSPIVSKDNDYPMDDEQFLDKQEEINEEDLKD